MRRPCRAPAVLKPIGILLALTYCFACFRGEEGNSVSRSKNRMLGPCWHYVGTFFALVRLVFALGRLLRACSTFFAHVVRFFRVSGRSGSGLGASKDDFGGSET